MDITIGTSGFSPLGIDRFYNEWLEEDKSMEKIFNTQKSDKTNSENKLNESFFYDSNTQASDYTDPGIGDFLDFYA